MIACSDIHLLVVDDENPLRKTLAAYFEDDGFCVDTAASAEDAMDIIKSGKHFNVAIVDLRLPNMNGEDFIIEASRMTPSTKFILHTGSSQYTLSNDLRASGLGDEQFLLKPVSDMRSFSELIQRLATK